MNVFAVRAGALVAGFLVTGCVYSTRHMDHDAYAGSVGKAVAVFPSAHKTSGNPGGDGADTTVQVPFLQLHFAAARYDTPAPPAKVIAYYRTELSKFGHVDQKAGGPHTRISGFSWTQGPGQTTLHAGDAIVAVKPLEKGSEFAIIRIDATK
jgi:hypothetical protein